jgi:ubiquinone/menaquinone biosynthesis C-methylase UbiE
MKYKPQKDYFQTAYNTGTDNWSQMDFKTEFLQYITMLPDEATVLDIGCGRGQLAFLLAEIGYKVIGIDYIEKIVKINNEEVKAKQLGGKLAFVSGDVFDIPLTDSSFDVVIDSGLLHHVHTEDWQDYKKEVDRVLSSDGYYLSVALCKETSNFMDWKPKNSDTPDFEKYGAKYHFFREGEVQKIFGENYEQIREEVFVTQQDIALLFTLLKKK